MQMDKITILGDAIKHMKVLQEKVKQLEVAAAQLNTSKSTVVVKKYQLSMNDDNDNDNDGSSSVLVDVMSASGGNNDDGSNNNNTNNVIKNSSSLPEIQIKILDDTLLLKVFCENRKGILSDLSEVVERHDLSITNYYVIPFQRFTLDITIVAQIEEGFNNNVKGFVRTLQSKLRSG
ncbi:transcription factor bHLH18-like [Chenopodium quinoa]|uniref:transcription factor bHLH18-like n=1 Tax=Chenopodium quinoa TaxID=63459 RepID=UPI000B789E53|nr:transcription factor bHLH18-like [Chenopodium quinoa]